MNILRTNLSKSPQFLSQFKDLTQNKPSNHQIADKTIKNLITPDRKQNFLTYKPKTQQISSVHLPSLKNSFDIRLKDIFDFAKQAVKEFQGMLDSLNTSGESFDMDKMLQDIKNMVIERVLWNKKGIGRATLDNIANFSDKLTNSQDISDLAMSYSRSFSLKLDISYEQKEFLSGKIRNTEFKFELDLEIKQEMQINYGWQDIKGSGLRSVNENTIDTGRYFLQFQSQSSFVIYDKTTSLSTRIWGDPHVDLSDMEGDFNGEFSDLKQSLFKTTFMLQDGTKITFNAPDSGVIETVSVKKENSFAFGIGTLPASNLSENQSQPVSLLIKDTGEDVVYAGGDGNDWYDADGNLLWGG